MSQFYQAVTAGSLPPSVPTSFVTDNGTVIPALNIVNVNGASSSTSNDNGITVIANPAGSNNEVIQLTNRVSGTVSTANATPTILTSFALGATPAVYNFDIQIVGYDLTDLAGVGYFISGSVRTTGAAASLVGTPDKITNEEAATITCDANLVVSGNNAIVEVTGINAKNINWKALSQYIFVS